MIVASLTLMSLTTYARNTRTVSATYTLYASEDMSIETAKLKALERAKLQAIEEAFGTHVSQVNATSIENHNGNSKSTFISYGGSEIQGEWIETTSEPQYNIYNKDDMLVVSVSLQGIIRQISNTRDNINARILRNGTDDKYESGEFFDGDEMYFSFSSSSKGHLIVYMLDNKSNAYRLLPYRKQQVSSVEIPNCDRHVFFDKKSAASEERRIVDEYILTVSQPVEINTVYVIFSPNEIHKAVDYQLEKELPRELSGSEFHRWLGNSRRIDDKLVVKEIPITIKLRK